MTEFDVVHRTVAGVERRRRWWSLAIGVVLAVAGLAAVVVGGVRIAVDQDDAIGDALGTGTVPGDAVTFDADDGPHTVFLLTPGVTNSDEVERQVAATECTAQLADGTTALVRGSRQAASVTTDRGSTVGWFTAVDGPTTVACEYVRDGQRPRDVAVARGTPDVSGESLLAIPAGVVAMLLGTALIARGWRGRTVISR